MSGSGKIIDELHAVHMPYTIRQLFVNKLSKVENIRYEIIIVDKKKLTFPLNHQTRNIAYNYFSGLLMSRIVDK